jgi:heat shock protein HslJ
LRRSGQPLNRLGPVIAALALAGCAPPVAIGVPPIEVGVPPRAGGLDGAWQVVELKRQKLPAAPEYQIRFISGRMSARFGCNLMGGTYRQVGNQLHVGSIDSTRMACSGPGAMLERDAGLILAQPMSMSWTSGDTLELTNRAGGIKLSRVR